MTHTQIIDHGLFLGQMLKEARLETAGLSLSLLNFGAATCDLRYIASGGSRPLILGYENPADYLENPAYMGVIAGRLAGRTKGARFELDGKIIALDVNEGKNHLHGGGQALSHVFWGLDLLDAATAQLTYTSPDGENGYPGAAKFTVTVRLEDNAVTYDMQAEVDQKTPISLAQHNYYNLAGGADTIWGHRLQMDADRVLMLDGTNVPSGDIESVAGGRFDFGAERSLLENDPSRLGMDHNLCFSIGRDNSTNVGALTAPDGLRMRVFSDQPGAQVYTAGGMAAQAGGLPGQQLGPFQGICIEPQGFPNAVNCPNFPGVMATPDRPYRQILRLEFDQT